MTQKSGASAQSLKDIMGFKRYGTTWTWLHKLGRIMIRPGRDRLKETVEVDETYIGGEEEGYDHVIHKIARSERVCKFKIDQKSTMNK